MGDVLASQPQSLHGLASQHLGERCLRKLYALRNCRENFRTKRSSIFSRERRSEKSGKTLSRLREHRALTEGAAVRGKRDGAIPSR
jgi:hypothetical protein